MEWKEGNGITPNLMLGNYEDEFFISYVASNFDKGMSETALCIREGDKYLILDGDWRTEYSEAYPNGLEACLNVFKQNRVDFSSTWSDRNCQGDTNENI